MKKPKFTIREYFEVFKEELKQPTLTRLQLLNTLQKPTPRNIWYFVNVTRNRLSAILLEKLLPQRNENGQINWPNYFAIQMRLGQPIKRSDVFPDGTDHLNHNDFSKRLSDFIKSISLKFNSDSITTCYDPIEFPEVIDEDFRPEIIKVNQLKFLRSAMGCSGHGGETKTGYNSSFMDFTIDWENPQSDQFVEHLESLKKEFQKYNLKILIMTEKFSDIGSLKISLFIEPPEGGAEPEKFNKSPECKAIRDKFWKEIAKIAEEMITP